MNTLLELFPDMKQLANREAVRWSNGLRIRTATYTDLYGKIGAVVRHFDDCHLSKGDRVLICAENRMEWVAVFWACVARGLEAVPVDFRFSPELVERIRQESQPRLVFDNASLDEVAHWQPEHLFTLSEISAADVVEIVYTSGTTSAPRGVVHRHRNICSNLRPFQKEIAKYRKWIGPLQPIRILDLLPLSHMFGQSQGLFIPVFLEGAAVFTNEIHPARIVQFVRENRVSVVVSVPRILENLRNEIERGTSAPMAHPSPSGVLRKIWRHRRVHRRFGWKFWAFVVGGARVDPELEEFWKQRGFAVIQGYGLTEASPVVAVNHPFDTRTGSLGKVVEGQDVMIAPDGEILVRGESVTTTNGDWLHTGDIGEIDADGRLYFRGRKKDTIVTPEGLNVHPEDIEAVLNALPDIRESCVIGTDHVHAVLILKSATPDVDALIREANKRLESHQRIREWSIWPHGEFPRTASTLKLKRHEIAQKLYTTAAPSPATTLPELSSMSSLERVEFLSQLENKYQVQLDEDKFSMLTSTRDLEDWLRRPETVAAPISSAPLSDWARAVPVQWFRTAFQHVLAMPLFRHYLPLTVTGLENLSELKPPVIFAPNHTSHLDVPALYTALPHQWHQRLAPAMMKDHFRAYFEPEGRTAKEVAEAAAAYFLACSIYNAFPLPLHMSGTRRALEYTAQLINRGFCPIVFPEGLRSPDGRIHEFRPGIGMMAVRLGVPVIPVRIRGLYEIYSLHDSWPRRGPIRVAIGKPEVFGADMTYEAATGRLEEAVNNL